MNVEVYGLKNNGERIRKPLTIIKNVTSIDVAEMKFNDMMMARPGRYTNRQGNDFPGFEFVEQGHRTADPVGHMLDSMLA